MNEATWQLEPVRDDPEKVYITSWDVTSTGGHKQVYLSNHMGSLSLHDKASLGAVDGQWGLFDTHAPGRYVLVLDNILYDIMIYIAYCDGLGFLVGRNPLCAAIHPVIL